MIYRRDIDGLRAVAVLAVMLFHFGLVGVSGGFVGVDVFFCISGYLIGGIIIDDTAAGSFSYARFYERRIKRLFPAFFAMALVTIPVGFWLLLPAPDFVQFGKSLVAATFYVPNLYFYRELGGYFGGNASNMPLLHTWSLGVEEQFYIFFPLLMRLAIRRGQRFTLPLMAITGALSLAYAQRRLSWNPELSFYWLQPRAWELLLGAAAALPSLREIRVKPWTGRLLSIAAVAAIVIPMLLYSDATPFPGIAAVPPCLGASWLLWYGRQHQDDVVPRWLGTRTPVFIGKLSYSLYLWHWPVYVFLAYHYSGNLSPGLRAAALLLVFVLAWLSWRFVEQPVRQASRPRLQIFSGALAGSLLVAGLGLWIWRNDGLPGRLSGDTRLVAAAAKDFTQTGGSCVGPANTRLPGIEHCKLGLQSAPDTFLVWADSHGRAMRDGLDLSASEQGTSGLLIWAAGCLPVFDGVKHESYTGPEADRACASQNRAIQSWLSNPGTIRKVLLIGRWSYYTSGSGIGEDAKNRIVIERAPGTKMDSRGVNPQQAATVGALMVQTVAWLHAHGYQVYVLEEVPEFPDFSGTQLFQRVRGGQPLSEALTQIGTLPRAAVEQRQSLAQAFLQQAVANRDATLLLTHPLFCPQRQCTVWSDNGQRYFDNNHLTVDASKRIRAVFAPALSPSPPAAAGSP